MFAELSHINEDREEGFTLIELLVVIVIIGILVAIAIGAFLNQRQKANDVSVESDVRNAVTQMKSVTMELEGKNLGQVTSTQNGRVVTVKAGDTELIKSPSDLEASGPVGKPPGSLTASINPSQLGQSVLASSSSSQSTPGTITLSPGVTLVIEGHFVDTNNIGDTYYDATVSYTIAGTHDNGGKYNKDEKTYYVYSYTNNGVSSYDRFKPGNPPL